MIKIAINGFGRIGRNAFKIAFERHDIKIVAINDLTDTKTLAHLLKHDSTYGTYDREVKFDDQNIIVDGEKIRVFSEKEPKDLPWSKLQIDVVIESTGFFTDPQKAAKHLDAGAKKVVISAPAKGTGAKTVVIGVNEDTVTKDDKKALEFFKKACDMGDKESCTLAAVMDGDNANLAKASEQHKKDCDSKGDILACGLFALFMEGKDNKEAAKYYKKACELGKNISDPALQNNPAFNDGIKQFCSRPAELEAQNLRAVQDVIKAKIAEEYRISCDSEENWVSCAIYASNRERRSKSGDAILRQGVQIGQKNHKYRF